MSEINQKRSNEALAWFHEKGRLATLGDIARILELASTIGRRASGLVTDKTEITGLDGGAIRIELEAALKKVYGDVVDVEALPMLTEGKRG